MKKIMIALLVIAFIFGYGIAFAEQTGTTLWHSHSYVDTNTDSYVDRYNEYQKKQGLGLGLGVDVVLYEFDGVIKDYGIDSVNTEYKYDLANKNQSVYGVVHVNAWRSFNKLLGK